MIIKSYLTAILIFTTILLSCLSSHAQNNSDSIQVIKRGMKYVYFQGNTLLSFQQVLFLTSSHPKTSKLLRKSNNMHNLSYVFGFAGGGCVGYSLGYILGTAVSANAPNFGVFVSTLVIGAGLIGIGIALEIDAKNKAIEAIAVYNHSKRQRNNKNLDVGFSPTGVLLRLSF